MKYNLAQVEITNQCNLDCPFCFRKQMNRYRGDMSLEIFNQTLDFCKKMEVPELWLHNWGEPLLHPKIYEFIQLAKKRKFRVGFTTNGSLLTWKVVEGLRKAKLDFLDISLNMDTNRYRAIHLLKWYERMNSNKIDCHLRVVVNNSAEYTYLSYLLDGKKVRWQRAMKHDNQHIRIKPCQAVDKVFVVLWDGTVVPCCHVINKEIILGEVDKTVDMHIDTMQNEYCRNCYEVEDEMPIRRKL